MTKSQAGTRSFRPASRILALIMGVSLIIIGLLGVGWHLVLGEHWLVGHNFGVDAFHVIMGLLALGAGGTSRSAKGYGGFAFVVFAVATFLAAAGPMLEQHEHVAEGVPTWLAENSLGFAEINYIVYFLMALWALLLTRTKIDVDPWGRGDAHSTMRAMPDREDAINDTRRKQLA